MGSDKSFRGNKIIAGINEDGFSNRNLAGMNLLSVLSYLITTV